MNSFVVHNDRAFYKKLIAIALPIALQQFITSSLNMIDSVMIGKLGETSISAVTLANKIFFLLVLLTFGVCSGSAIFTSQYWGKKDIKNIRRILGLCLMIGTMASLLFAVIAIVFPNQAMGIFIPEQEVIHQGSQYLRIIGWSYPITAITFSYVFVLRSINEVRLPVVITASSIVVNTVLNYLLIFGNFGLPALGVRGAAIATVVARLYECFTLLFIVYRRKGVVAAKFHEMFDITRPFFIRYIKTVSPVMANEFAWALGTTMYSVAYGRMGNDVVAAIAITQIIEQLALVLFQGVANATGVILGNEIGANEKDLAYYHGKKLLKIGVVGAIIIGGLLLVISGVFINLFAVSDVVKASVRQCLLVFVLFMPFKIFNFINIVGILRSGGDTTFTLLLDAGGVWLIGTPAAFIGGVFFGLPIPFVYALVMSEEIVKLTIGLPRMVRKKWLKNLVEQEAV